MDMISHVREFDMKVQTNEDHQRGVAKRAELFAAKFGMGGMGTCAWTIT